MPASLYEIRDSAGKGKGVFASRSISKGTIVCHDRKALDIPKPAPEVTDSDVQTAFDKLSTEDQATYLTLHEDKKEIYDTKLLRIFHANAFGDLETRSYFYLTISRFNHACVPNARMREDKVVTEQDIAAGEELFISYADPWYETMNAAQRAKLLGRHYGFECQCIACRPGPRRILSDMRRQLIKVLRFALEGLEPPSYRSLEHVDFAGRFRGEWPPARVKLRKPLNYLRKVEFAFLLAKLRHAESLSALAVAESFARAAQVMMDYLNIFGQDPRTSGLYPLEPARYVKAWLDESLILAKPVCPKGDTSFEMLQKNAEVMSRFTLIQLATNFDAFALFGDDETVPPQQLSAAEFEGMMRQRLR